MADQAATPKTPSDATPPRFTVGFLLGMKSKGLDLVGDDAAWQRLHTEPWWVADLLTHEDTWADQPIDAQIEAVDQAMVAFYPDPDPNHTKDNNTEAANPWRAIFELAGKAGVNPRGFTARELWWMATGAMDRASLVASYTLVAAGSKGKDVQDLNPMRKPQEPSWGSPRRKALI